MTDEKRLLTTTDEARLLSVCVLGGANTGVLRGRDMSRSDNGTEWTNRLAMLAGKGEVTFEQTD